MSDDTYAIGVDLGGTTVKTGLVTTDGAIVTHSKFPSLAEDGPSAVIAQIKKSIDVVLQQVNGGRVIGIGIGSPGIVEKQGGVVMDPPNMSQWDSVALGDEIEKSFNTRVEVENDANAAAIAEARFGAGKNFPDFLFVIWGTGVGGGIILDRKIFRGPHGGAGEIGHIVVDYNGLPCNCGATGCVEAYVGQKHLSQRTAERIKNYPDSEIWKLVGGDESKIEPKLISEAAQKGDVVAHEILEEAGTILGVALGAVMNTIDLRVSVIGGGVSAAGSFVIEAIARSIKAHVLKPLKNDIVVVPAQLGNDAGILGAAGLVL
jgi:glucokinase